MISGRALAVVACLLAAPALAQTQTHSGVVAQVRIDSRANAMVCMAIAPPMPGAAWACLHPNQAQYEELKELLFRAFATRAPCTFEWTVVDSMTNRARLDALSCFAPPAAIGADLDKTTL